MTNALLPGFRYVAPKKPIFSCIFLSFSPLFPHSRKEIANRKNKCHFLYRLWSRTKFRFSLDLWFLIFLALLPFHEFFMLFFRYLNWSTFATSCCTREPSTLALTRKLRAPLQKKLRAQLERLTGARSAPVAPVHTVLLDAKTNKYLLKIESSLVFEMVFFICSNEDLSQLY